MAVTKVGNDPVIAADDGAPEAAPVKGVRSREYNFPEFEIFGDVHARRLHESAVRRWMRREPEIPYIPTIKKMVERMMIDPSAEVHICLYVDRSGSMTDYQMMILSQLSRIFRVMGEENGLKISLMLASYEGGNVDVLLPMTEMSREGQVMLSRVVVKGFEITGGDETSFDAIDHGRRYFAGLAEGRKMTPFIVVLTDEEARQEDAATGRQEKKEAAVQAARNEGIETIVVHDLKREFSLDEKGGKRTWRALLDDICYMLKNMGESYGEAGIADLKWLASESNVFLFRVAALMTLKPKLSLAEAVETVYFDPEWQKRLWYPASRFKGPAGDADVIDSVEATSPWTGLAILKELGTEAAMAQLLYIALHAMSHGHLAKGEFLSAWGLNDTVILDAVMSQKEFRGVAGEMHNLFGSPRPETINEIVKRIAATLEADFAMGVFWYSAFFYIPEVRDASAILDKIRERAPALADELAGKGGSTADVFETVLKSGVLKESEVVTLIDELLAGGIKNNTTYLTALLSSLPEGDRERYFDKVIRSAKTFDEKESFRIDYLTKLNDHAKILKQIIWYFERMAKRAAAYEASDLPDFGLYCGKLLSVVKLGVDKDKEDGALAVIMDGLRKGGEVAAMLIRGILLDQALLPGQYGDMIYGLNDNEGKAEGVAVDVMQMFYQRHHKEFISFALKEIRGENSNELGRKRLFAVIAGENELMITSDDLSFFLALAADKDVEKEMRTKVLFMLPDRLAKEDRRKVRNVLRKISSDKSDPLHQLILNTLKRLMGNMVV